MEATLALPAARLQELRRRTIWALVAGVALGSTGHIAAVTVSSIVAQSLGGRRSGPAYRARRSSSAPPPEPSSSPTSWSGAAAGSASASATRSASSARSSRPSRSSADRSPACSSGPSRRVRQRLEPAVALHGRGPLRRTRAARRRSALVVWGATVGAVVGPNLVAPAGEFAMSIGPAGARRSVPRAGRVRRRGRAADASSCCDRTRTSSPIDPERDLAATHGSTAASLASVLRRPPSRCDRRARRRAGRRWC